MELCSKDHIKFMNHQTTLFENQVVPPLAARVRPQKFESFKGQDHIFKKYPFLKQDNFPSLILWGPPGTGKTTLAHLLAKENKRPFYTFNAVLGGVSELRKLIHNCEHEKDVIIFLDEIHRFNKAQQDALLPYIENGQFTLIGATTEHPKSSLNNALLSRVQIVVLKKHNLKSLEGIIQTALNSINEHINQEMISLLAQFSSGDARMALNLLEVVINNKELSQKELLPLIKQNSREYDKNDNRHYDVISAFIKSMRGSDPQAALLWLAVMIDGGEDPVFIARRLVIFASEDIGNADPTALILANNVLQIVQNIGMPEARISLSQVTTYLASTVKSNAAYKAINEALDYVRSKPTIEVPDHLKNFPPPSAQAYKYPHNYPGNYVKQNYTLEELPNFYRPSENGREKFLKERIEKLI
ncbi:MAG: replication-associated recombination protein A [Bdellovibrionales bacterium]|nr:replication-associated recombination protein A [Bdellovibrionales bacterium]